MRSLVAGLSAALVVAGASAGAPTSREIAFVANAEDATVSLVDLEARRVVGLIDINPDRTTAKHAGADNFAQDTEVSPDGRTLYVSRGYLRDVAAFDIATGRMLWKTSLNTARSDHMSVSPDGRTIFISALTDNAVYRIATRDGAITGHVQTGIWPHDTKFSKDGRRIYNSSIGVIKSLGVVDTPAPTEHPDTSYQLTVADPVTLKVLDRIKLETPFRPWAFAPGENRIYAELSNQRVVVTYDLAQRKVVQRLELPSTPGAPVPDWLLEAPYHGLALSPDGRILCLAGRESDLAVLVHAPTLSKMAVVKVGAAPGWAEIAQGGRVCLLPNGRSNDLSIISIASGTEIARLPVGRGPRHVRTANIPEDVLASVARAQPLSAKAAP